MMEDAEFIRVVEKHPKLFAGFSDTTVNRVVGKILFIETCEENRYKREYLQVVKMT